MVTDLKPLAPPIDRQWLRLVRLLAAGQNNLRKKTAKNNTYKSKIIIPTLYKVRHVNISLHCKFRSRAWRPRADLPDSLVRFENAIIDIDVVLEVGIPLLNTILKVVFVPIK